LKEWIFTTIAGFEREAADVVETGVGHSSRARFTAALGRPGGFGSSAMPKTRQQGFDLHTHEPGGSPNLTQISGGISLYCDGRLGSAAQAAAFLATQGGPAPILPAHQSQYNLGDLPIKQKRSAREGNRSGTREMRHYFKW
jgi:hypothetical protein